MTVSLLLLPAASAGPAVVVRASVNSIGRQGNADSYGPVLSRSGRFAAFGSAATNLVAGDTNGARDVFLHDGKSGRTVRVSLGDGGAQANGDSGGAGLSADGRVVAFWSKASN